MRALVVDEAEQVVEGVLAVDLLAVEHAVRHLHERPQVPLGLARRVHGLLEHRRAPLGVAELALSLHPQGHGQHDVGVLGGQRRVHLVHHDERVEDALLVALAQEAGEVRHGLRPVVVRGPQEVEVALRHLAEDLHRVHAGLLDGVEVALGQIPDGLGVAAVLGVGHQEVGGQAVRERAHLAGRAAGRGLAGERERAAAGAGDLAGEQVDVVDVVVHPGAAVVLVHAHRPQRHDVLVGVGELERERLQVLRRHAGELRGVLEGVGRQARGVLLERDGAHGVDGLAHVACVVAVVGGVADVLGALLELQVVVHEGFVVLLVLHEVVRDAVRDGQVGVRLEQHDRVGAHGRAGAQRAQVVVLHVLARELPGREARVQHGVRLGHVGAPGDEHVGVVEVGVAAGRLVGLEHVHEAHHGAGHAQARVRVDVVRKQTRLDELGAGVSLGDGLLAGEPERQAGLVGLPRFLELRGHELQRLVPCGLAQALVGALRGLVLADERLGQTVVTVEDLAQVVALHAVESLVGKVLRVARHAHELAVLHLADHAASAAAEPAHGRVLLPLAARRGARGARTAVRAAGHRRKAARRCGARQRDGRRLDECSS